MRSLRKVFAPSLAVVFCLTPCACRSAYVQTAIVNHSGDKVQLVEVDYPSASFGTQQIDNNATYNYRFKILDSGAVKITYMGAGNKTYTATGPQLRQGQQGTLTVTLDGGGKVDWATNLSPPK